MKRLWLVTLCLVGVGRIAGAPAGASAEELCRLGQAAVQRGEYAAAAGLLEQAVVLAPRESGYAHWLGNSYAWAAATAPMCDKPALGRKCLAAYLRAVELDPNNLPARFSLMNFYRRVPPTFLEADWRGRMTWRARSRGATRCRAPMPGPSCWVMKGSMPMPFLSWLT